jgi:UDP-glucose 4-epimerase
MVIPRFVKQALQNEPLTVYGDGQQSRCFFHVQDAVAAVQSLADKPIAEGQVYNIGSLEEITIQGLAEAVLEQIARLDQSASPIEQIPIKYIPYEEAYSKDFDDMRRRVPDISKIQTITGWSPKYNLSKILTDVIAENL